MIAGYQPVIQHLSAEFQVGYVEGQQKERIRIRESVKKKLKQTDIDYCPLGWK